MKPVTQTKRGGPDVAPDERGDCFDACLASLLEVGIEDVPCPHTGDWWDDAQAAVMRHGYRILLAAHEEDGLTVREVAEWFGPVCWIAGVPSLNLGTYEDGRPVMHVIVMRGVDIAHDPSLGDRYSLGSAPDMVVNDALLLVPLEPRSARP